MVSVKDNIELILRFTETQPCIQAGYTTDRDKRQKAAVELKRLTTGVAYCPLWWNCSNFIGVPKGNSKIFFGS